MPRYYLHIHNSSGFVEDEEGHEQPDLRAARDKALDGIRSLLAEEVRQGMLDLRGRIEIAGDTQQILSIVRFAEAVDLRLEQEMK